MRARLALGTALVVLIFASDARSARCGTRRRAEGARGAVLGRYRAGRQKMAPFPGAAMCSVAVQSTSPPANYGAPGLANPMFGQVQQAQAAGRMPGMPAWGC